jgi:hypothetical protein
MDKTGTFNVAYQASDATPVAGNELKANDTVLRGTINGQTVTVKCTWTGSVGGVLAVAKQIDLTSAVPGFDGWMATTNIGSTGGVTLGTHGTLYVVATGSKTLEPGLFTNGETLKADASMSDSFQSSTISFTKPNLPAASAAEIIGVVPFEWVANTAAQFSTSLTSTTTTAGSTTVTVNSTAALTVNAQLHIPGAGAAGATLNAHIVSIPDTTHVVIETAATTPVTGITTATASSANPIVSLNANQASQLLQSGLFLSQLTGSTADNGTAVYPIGRNFDSGTRLAALNEVGLGTAGAIQQVAPDGTSTSGVTGSITNLGLTPTNTLYSGTGFTQTFAIGNDGFASGGTLAGWLATPGSLGAAPTSADLSAGRAPALDGALTNEGGWLIGYLSRGDANTALAGTPNTAHRLIWNGALDWPAATGAAAQVASTNYLDSNVQEGVYTFWEYEHFLRKTGTVATGLQPVYDGIYTQLTGTATGGATVFNTADATVSGILAGSMHVAKTGEGGVITHK